MDVFYFLSATMGTVGVSLIWLGSGSGLGLGLGLGLTLTLTLALTRLVRAISTMLRQKQDESRGDEEANALNAIVELVFNGWDMLETTTPLP